MPMEVFYDPQSGTKITSASQGVKVQTGFFGYYPTGGGEAGSEGGGSGGGSGSLPAGSEQETLVNQVTQGQYMTQDQFAAAMAGIQSQMQAGQEQLASQIASIPANVSPAQTTLYEAGTSEVVGTPTALPLIGALVPLTVGFLRALLIRFGPTLLKMIIGAAAFKEFLDLIGIGASDDTVLRNTAKYAGVRKRRRYSIGANPRVGTLAKVSRHCSRLLKRHEKVIREFIPKPRPRTYGIPPAKMLSSAERKLLASGG